MIKRIIKVIIASFITILVLFCIFIISIPFIEGRPHIFWIFHKPKNEEILTYYYNYSELNQSQWPVAEDMLMDPLIIAGDSIVPTIIKEVKNKNMPLRRYAIGFLGNGSYKESLPILINILCDKSEFIYYRYDSLESIYNIDRKLALKYSYKFKNMKNMLGELSNSIINNKFKYYERTWIQAYFSNHE